jgi:hypothetical protein
MFSSGMLTKDASSFVVAAFADIVTWQLNPQPSTKVGAAGLNFLQAEAYSAAADVNVALQILGEFLNTVVQTLVAGAFVAYMPKTIFWLGAVITGWQTAAAQLSWHSMTCGMAGISSEAIVHEGSTACCTKHVCVV